MGPGIDRVLGTPHAVGRVIKSNNLVFINFVVDKTDRVLSSSEKGVSSPSKERPKIRPRK
jgi:hypothetical protein